MALVRDIKTESNYYFLLIILCKKFDMAEIETLWLSCIEVWSAHFTSESSVFP